MIKLSKAMDSAFGRLISGTGEKLYSITRKNERRAAVPSTTKTGKKHLYSYKSLAPGVKGRHMEALVVSCSPLRRRTCPCTTVRSSFSSWTDGAS